MLKYDVDRILRKILEPESRFHPWHEIVTAIDELNLCYHAGFIPSALYTYTADKLASRLGYSNNYDSHVGSMVCRFLDIPLENDGIESMRMHYGLMLKPGLYNLPSINAKFYR